MDYMIFRQLFEHETSTYTYFIGDESSREAFVIDPVVETFERDAQLITDLKLKLKYILDTHVHADHITAANLLKEKFGGQTAISKASQASNYDIYLSDRQILKLGGLQLTCFETPGHTSGCVSYYIPGMVFTGDSLMINSAGRTDFQEGSAEKLFESIHEKLFSLPDNTIVYPGHDYKTKTSSTIGEEKKNNSRISLDKSKNDFIKIMNELNLPYPKKMDTALPANLKGGKL